MKLTLAILISGRGSNMQALIEACADPSFPARIAVVISNRPEAPGLARAQDAGIKTLVVDHKNYPDRQSFDAALHDALVPFAPDLICLAGFMRLLGADFIKSREGRIINIHPSLLPAYTGLHTHERVLADGMTETGCTVHIVTPELDDGPILLQKRVPVLPGDTPDSLAARVLAQEHSAYPEAVRLMATSLLKKQQNRV